ncbi:ribosome silencing factor [Desulfothermus naphthae]
MQNQNSVENKVENIANWLLEKKAKDVVSIDISEFGSITDVIIIASSLNPRHNQALADFVLEKVSENKWEYLGMEGYKPGNWILIDLNEIIVHLFLEETREFYNIEGLWRGAKKTFFESKEMTHEEF